MHFTHRQRADGTRAETVCWLDDHSRMVLHLTCHRRVTGLVAVDAFRAGVAAYSARPRR